MRDLDGSNVSSQRTSIEGYLHRQDNDLMRRWRKWWCKVEDGAVTVSLYDSMRISDVSNLARDRQLAKLEPTQ